LWKQQEESKLDEQSRSVAGGRPLGDDWNDEEIQSGPILLDRQTGAVRIGRLQLCERASKEVIGWSTSDVDVDEVQGWPALLQEQTRSVQGCRPELRQGTLEVGGAMGIQDRLKRLTKKAEEAGAEHKQQLEKALEKAEVAADRKTGGQYHDQIQKVGSKADAYIENLESQKGPGSSPDKQSDS
jgi:hypothetical protein